MALVNRTERAKQYLLDTLSAADKSRFEEDYFTDDEVFEEIEIAEGELIDAYIHKELSASDQNKFETNLINSPRLAQRVEFARTLTKSISKAGSSATDDGTQVVPLSVENQAIAPKPAVAIKHEEPLWRRILLPKSSSPRSVGFALATYTLLFLLGGGALFVAWMRLRTQSRRLGSERAELQQYNQNLALESDKQKSELAAQLAEARAENARLLQQLESASKGDQHAIQQDKTVAFLLIPGGLRSTGRRNVVEIFPHTANVRLRLVLPKQSDSYSSYSASIKTAEQTTVWSKPQLKPNGKIVELRLPGFKLPRGTYLVELSGFNDAVNSERLPDYSFQVVRKGN